MPSLTVNNLSKNFGSIQTLRAINLSLKKGEVTAVIGPSGAGKTTLLRCLGLLEHFDEGKISMGDTTVTAMISEKDTERLRKNIGFVFQDFNLWPHKTVLENVAESLITVKKWPTRDAHREATTWLKKVDMLDKLKSYPDDLSGGQKQRVAIARALALRPEILLLDEITSALDPELAAGILKIIKRLAKDGMTLLIVTHHLKFAREISDRIIFLDQGGVIEEGAPEQMLENPRSSRLKKFLENEQEALQEITVYEGFEDFQAFHVGLLKRMKRGSIGYVVGAVGDRWFESMGPAYREYEMLLREKNITWKWVSYKVEPREREIQKQLGTRLHIRLIPKEFATPSNFNIWDDTIILQTFGDPPAVIEIRNKYLVKGYMNYFNLLWEMGEHIV